MSVLENLEPKKVFYYFEKICGIPHGSGNTEAIASYYTTFAEERGLSWYRDEANNVLIRKPASKGSEEAPVLILQGHLDMVCEKEENLAFDFEKEAIHPVVDDDFVKASGTTLGGDNGIAAAMMLAILDDEELVHPPLEVLFTADEEIGMVGAFAFDCRQLNGKRLINLDSEEEGVIMCSCAGGVDACSILPVAREKRHGVMGKIQISGLTGGHSGVEIDKGRANANILMSRILYDLTEKTDMRVVSIIGGTRETAIAASAEAIVLLEKEETKSFSSRADLYYNTFSKEYQSTEPSLSIIFSAEDAEAEMEVLTTESTRRMCRVLRALPDGVQVMSADLPGLVQTSVNLGIVKLEKDELRFTNTIRSSMRTQKFMVFHQIASVTALAGGVTKARGEYPGWAYRPDSVLKQIAARAYEDIAGRKAEIQAVHAGLECGLFADSISELDCISIGPDMGNVHTPQEYLRISSVDRTYRLLETVLRKCAVQ